MPWLFFALALGAILIAFNTFSIGLAAVCLLAALGLIIAGTLNLASARISKQSKHPAVMLDAKALAEVRKRAANKGGGGAEAGVASAAAGGGRSKTQDPTDAMGDGSGGGDGGGD